MRLRGAGEQDAALTFEMQRGRRRDAAKGDGGGLGARVAAWSGEVGPPPCDGHARAGEAAVEGVSQGKPTSDFCGVPGGAYEKLPLKDNCDCIGWRGVLAPLGGT